MNTTERKQEQAAVTLLKSTGLGVLEAAQLVCAVVGRFEASYPTDSTPTQVAESKNTPLFTWCMKIIDAGIEAAAQRERTVSLAEAGWASVEARGDCRATTRRDLRYFLRKVLKVQLNGNTAERRENGVARLRQKGYLSDFSVARASETSALGEVGALPLRAITTAQCREILQRAFGHSKSMYIKGRALLHSVFAYGMRQEWCDANPVARIEVPKVVEAPKEPLVQDEVQRLRAAVEQAEHRDMKLSVNLLLYSGIRPAEISRLRAEDFCWQEGVVIIRPTKSKTGGGRVVPLRGVARLKPQERVIPRNWQRRWRALRQAAGFSRWVPDVCRHTFASYHAAYFRNLPELQLEMGHRDCGLLRTRYMSPLLKKEARKFWLLNG